MNFETLIQSKDFSNREKVTIKRNQYLFSLTKINDKILVKEECDGYHKEMFSKEEIIKMLDELREWINL